jgi:hypothetical protein
MFQETSIHIRKARLRLLLVGWMAGWNLNDKSDDTFVGTFVTAKSDVS